MTTTTIKITCNTKSELMTHLSYAREQINKLLKHLGRDEPIDSNEQDLGYDIDLDSAGRQSVLIEEA